MEGRGLCGDCAGNSEGPESDLAFQGLVLKWSLCKSYEIAIA
jgi:hypothetical protein